MPQVKPQIQTFAKIKVVGIGGGGCNAVTRMSEASIKGVEFIAINTDAQDLHYTQAKHKLNIGKNLTRGLGTGMNPELGQQAAEENREEIVEALKGADMIFITAGFGGWTGSGASPIVAEIAKEIGALCVGVVTKPFSFEGAQRARIAEEALAKFKDRVDALITIPNDRVFAIIEKDTPLTRAFEIIDDVLRHSVQGISEIVAAPGIINVDFADVKAILNESGPAIVGIGISAGNDRHLIAAKQAIQSPLIELSIDGAKGVLFSVAGGTDLKMLEIQEAAKIITESIDSNAKVIFGAYHDRRLRKGSLKVTVIAAGFNNLGFIKPNNFPTLFSIKGEPKAKKPEITAVLTSEEVEIKTKDIKDAHKDTGEGKKEEIEALEKEKIWEIPTFLRRRRR